MTTPTQILFVRQRHDAKRAGLHNDYRVVIGDKAFSWASKKGFPEVGKPTILWEQPVHHASYLNNPDITIPEGQYGAGRQVIDYAQKGRAEVEENSYHLELNNGDRFLIKKAPESYGDKAWLFLRKKNVSKEIEKSASAAEEALAGAGVLATIKPATKSVLSKGVPELRQHKRKYQREAYKAGKPFSKPFMDKINSGASENVAMEKRLLGKVKGIKVGGTVLGAGLIGHAAYRMASGKPSKKSSRNRYLEKAAALGDSDMLHAYSKVNRARKDAGKEEIPLDEFRNEFRNERGYSRRIVGALGLGAAIPGIGVIPGYFLGKAYDNKNAAKRLIESHTKQASEKKRDRGTAVAETLAGVVGAGHVSDAPSKLLGYHKMYHGTSKENAKNILREGLRKTYGGTRGSKVGQGTELDHFTSQAKKFVYMTPNKMIGRTFAGDSAKHINQHGPASPIATINTVVDGLKNGKVLKARVSHKQWEKGFQMDPDSFSFMDRVSNPESKLKGLAARSRRDIASHQFSGGKGSKGVGSFLTKNNLRRYYGSASGRTRAAIGAAQLLGGSALAAGAVAHNKGTGGILSKDKK